MTGKNTVSAPIAASSSPVAWLGARRRLPWKSAADVIGASRMCSLPPSCMWKASGFRPLYSPSPNSSISWWSATEPFSALVTMKGSDMVSATGKRSGV